jgi:hypothetical protein
VIQVTLAIKFIVSVCFVLVGLVHSAFVGRQVSRASSLPPTSCTPLWKLFLARKVLSHRRACCSLSRVGYSQAMQMDVKFLVASEKDATARSVIHRHTNTECILSSMKEHIAGIGYCHRQEQDRQCKVSQRVPWMCRGDCSVIFRGGFGSAVLVLSV